jgi:hypothetical protein
LRSEEGPEVTILEPGDGGVIFWLDSTETLDTRIEGFTLRASHHLGGPPWGLAVWVTGSAGCTVVDCVIAGNQAVDEVAAGNAVTVSGGILRMRNCTVAANQSEWGNTGGLSLTGGAVATLERCIVFGNCLGDVYVRAGSLTLECCIVGSVWVNEDEGTITYIDPIEGDPLFCDLPSCGDATVDPVQLRVEATSPALPGNNACGELIGALGVGCPVTDVPGGDTSSPSVRLTSPRPNPASEGFAFELAVETECRARIELFDARGRRIDVVYEGSLPAGTHTFAHEWGKKQNELPRVLWLRASVTGAVGGESLATRIVRVN